nr:alpha/beta hydrolase [Caulobacter sp. 17J80-11]
MAGVAVAAALAAGGAEAKPQPPLGPGEHQVVVNGVRLWYRVAGRPDGTPVVFLHGGPGEGSQAFAKLAGPAVEPGLRMVYLDQRGGGRSERPWTNAYSLDLLVEDLEALRAAWGAPKIDIIGHSFGTIVGLEYAARHPDRVAHLVLAAAVPDIPAALDLQCARLERIDPQAYQAAVASRPEGRRCNAFGAGKAFVDANMYPDPATMAAVDAADAEGGLRNTGEIGAALFGAGLEAYRFGQPERLTMPVLVIAGAKDFQASIEPQRALVANLPNARMLEYADDGHFMFVEEPDRFARDVAAFLKH